MLWRFLSYQLNPPQNRENSGFFRGKPTFRAVSWQITRAFHVISQGWFSVSRIFYVRTSAKFTFANKIEAMHGRSLVSVKVEPRSASRFSSALFILPLLIYLIKIYVRLSCVAKNASVEINLKKVRNLINFFDFIVTVDVTAPIYGDVYQKAPCVHHRHQWSWSSGGFDKGNCVQKGKIWNLLLSTKSFINC